MQRLLHFSVGLPRQRPNTSKLIPRAVALAGAPRPRRSAHLSTSALLSNHNSNALVDSTHVLEPNRTVQVQWDDGHTSHYDFTWLRVNCPSFLHESGQRTVFSGDVGPEIKPVEVTTPDSMMSVRWSDGHVSVYRADWLRAHDNSPSALHERRHGSWPAPLCSWDAIPKVDGAEYMSSEEGLYAALTKVNRAGVCLLKNVGTEEGTVLDLARRVAPVSHTTLYGPMFHVVSQSTPRNMAYTNNRLRLHMDLAYYESPPGLQLLHCVRFDEGVTGGASTFLDAFAAADYFRVQHPDYFETLSKIPTSFRKVRGAAPWVEGEDRNREALASAHMEYERPIFQVDPNGDILAVTWAPMFEGVLMCEDLDAAAYHKAHAAFLHMIEEGPYAEDHTVRQRLTPGDCLVFNNRRLLHGRDAFSGGEGGSRLLQGCYVNIDDAMSRLCSLHLDHQPSGDDPDRKRLARMGNGSLPSLEYVPS